MCSNRAESHSSGWAVEEFKEVNLGDQRLTSRLIKLADRFSALPESPILENSLLIDNDLQNLSSYLYRIYEVISQKWY